MKIVTKIGYILGLLLFLVSFFVPTVQLTEDFAISGILTFLMNAGMLVFVENGAEYFEYIFGVLTNVWVVFLLVRFWRKNDKKWLTIIVSLLAVLSGVYWIFKVPNTSMLLFGFWLWLAGVVLVCLANVLKRNQVA